MLLRHFISRAHLRTSLPPARPGNHDQGGASEARPRRELRVARCPDILCHGEVEARSLDVHEETLPPARGTPVPKSHLSLGKKSDVLHLVIIPLRLSRPVVSSHVYVASKILPWCRFFWRRLQDSPRRLVAMAATSPWLPLPFSHRPFSRGVIV